MNNPVSSGTGARYSQCALQQPLPPACRGTRCRSLRIASFLKNESNKPIHLTLAKDQVRTIKQGHPWLYKEALAALPASPPGRLAVLKTKTGEIIAKGIYDPRSSIAFRVCALTQRLDNELIEARLQRALKLRRSCIDPSATSGYRLVNGEGDGLPGLVCDVYGQAAVMKLDGAGPAAFYDAHQVADWVIKNVDGCCSVYLKYRAGQEAERGAWLRGPELQQPVQFQEHGVQFVADLVKGQKTGFFLDQRENRKLLMPYCRNNRVLNLFGYTGGFSVYAGVGGASHVTTVDVAEPALAMAQQNWRLNTRARGMHEVVAVDAFDFLAQAKKEQQQWDVVVVDPPSFAPNKAAVLNALDAYVKLFVLAAQVTASCGVLALSSCSSHVSSDMFTDVCNQSLRKARRQASVIGIHGQPADHPWPVACKELSYLKFNLYLMDG